MIRILHFAAVFNRHDFIDTVLTRLDRSKFEIRALLGQPAWRTGAYAPGESYPARYLNFPFHRRTYPRMLAALRREILEYRPHIVHAHHYDESLVAAVAVRMTGVPCFVVGHHYSDHIYFLSKGFKRRVFLAAEAFVNRTATRIVVPSLEVERILVDWQGVPASKVATIPYGLDLRRYEPSSPDAPGRLRRQVGADDKFLIVVCCRLNPEKGLDHLVRAIHALGPSRSRLKLVMAGDGASRNDLERLAASLGVADVIEFVGWRDDALDWIAAADLVAQPSMCESYCQVLVEALAFSNPVVMTPVGAAPEIIGDNQRGRLVPRGDSAALADVIAELMNDPEKGRALGAAGRAFLERALAPDLIARRHEEMYETALAGARIRQAA